MRSFIRHWLLFLLPLVLGVGLLYVLPYDKSFSYQYIKGDCKARGEWIYDRLFQNQRPVDIAFLGSSRTINAVNERQLQAALKTTTNKDWQVLNLGYCRLGRNLHHVLLKDLLATKKLKYLFVEVRLEENRFSHPIFPYLADNEEILHPIIWGNSELLHDSYLATQSRLAFWRQQILGGEEPPATATLDYGHGYSDIEADTAHLKRIWEKTRLTNTDTIRKTTGKAWTNRFARQYLERIVEECHHAGVQVHFVYIPRFGLTAPPRLSNYYREYGALLIPPEKLSLTFRYWTDEEHMNNKGAYIFSNWLGEEMSTLLD